MTITEAHDNIKTALDDYFETLNTRDVQIGILKGCLKEVHCLLTERRNRGVTDAIYRIETVFPEVKNG